VHIINQQKDEHGRRKSNEDVDCVVVENKPNAQRPTIVV